MHKHIGSVLFVFLFVILFAAPSVFDAVFAFFFAGVIPNTKYIAPVPVMLAIDALLLALSLYALAKQLMLATSPVKQDLANRKKARQKVLKITSANQVKTSRPKKRYQAVVEH